MDLSTIERLAALNQQFYAEHAENFAEARPRLPVGVARVLSAIAPGARVLEVGCGDGKVGRALARSGVAAYVGLDGSAAMLERARRFTSEAPKSGTGPLAKNGTGPLGRGRPVYIYVRADLAEPNWAAALPAERYNWILAFAVLHHLPGYALRAGVLQTLAQRLAPGGRVAVSNWQFTRSERLKKRIVPWAEAGLSDGDVEPGDYLLSWERRGTHGLRYVHLLERAELERAAAGAGLRLVETFSADGISGDLSDYVVMRHAD